MREIQEVFSGEEPVDPEKAKQKITELADYSEQIQEMVTSFDADSLDNLNDYMLGISNTLTETYESSKEIAQSAAQTAGQGLGQGMFDGFLESMGGMAEAVKPLSNMLHSLTQDGQIYDKDTQALIDNAKGIVDSILNISENISQGLSAYKDLEEQIILKANAGQKEEAEYLFAKSWTMIALAVISPGSNAGKANVVKSLENLADTAKTSVANYPTGRKHSQMNQPKNPEYQPVRNSPATINGVEYSGHAIDRMQDRGLTPSVIENILKNGIRDGSLIRDPVNNITVITNPQGKIVTVRYEN